MRRVLMVAVMVMVAVSWVSTAMAVDPSPYTVEEQANLAAAQACVNAFAAGNMDDFYALLDDNVVWEINGSNTYVPSHGKWIGIDAVRDWVDLINQEMTTVNFGADQYFVDGDTVIILMHEQDTVPATAKSVDEREVALMTFSNGKIVNCLVFDDSAQEQWALTPES